MFESLEKQNSEGVSGRLRSFNRSRKRSLAWLGAFLFVLPAAVVASAFFWFFSLPDDPLYVIPAILGVVFGSLLLFFLSGRLFRMWSDAQEPTADEAMANDPRPPILYLRPFQADSASLATLDSESRFAQRSLSTQPYGCLGSLLFFFLLGYRYGTKKRSEELVVDLLKPLGPVVAIGRPGERVPRLGASRLYVGDNWKEVVRDLMERSQLIVMFAGTTPGFAWEIAEVFRKAPFVPTVLLLPYFHAKGSAKRSSAIDSQNKKKKYLHRDEDIERFIEIFTTGSGLKLPADLSELRQIRAIYFPSPTETILMRDLGTAAEYDMHLQNPFLSALGRVLHRDDPAWVEWAARTAEEENATTRNELKRARKVYLVVVLVMVVIGAIIGLMQSN